MWRKVNGAGLGHEVLKEELMDHLCCAIEQRISMGEPFVQAFHAAFADWGEDEMKNVETETISLIQSNRFFMKKMLISLAAGLFLLTTTLFSMQQDPPSGLPLKGLTEVASGFGYRHHPILKQKKQHKGVDFKAPLGTPVYATGDGVVAKVDYDADGYGHCVIIQHDSEYSSVFAQMTSDVRVSAGQKVKAGQLIGHVGSSGKSTGPHLHYEVRKNGEPVDPEAYFSR